MKLAVIPARGGSKRIPRKNIKNFLGKPMIAYSIEAAINSGSFDRVIVSTDDEEISNVAKKYGADVPFLRPSELSNDYTATVPVIKHAIEQLSAEGFNYEYVCCIYATAPFIEEEDIKTSYELLVDSECDYTLPVTTYAYPIQRAMRQNKSGSLEMLYPENWSVRSQDLEEVYHDVGQFYWGKTQAWLQEKPLLGVGSNPVIIPRYRAQDIDTLEDWKLAEVMHRVINAET